MPEDIPHLKQAESFCLASILFFFSGDKIFYLLRIITITATVITLKPRSIGGRKLNFPFYFFLKEAVGDCIASRLTTATC